MAAGRDVLVVEGGGLRGAFSAGVLSELARSHALNLDACYATSSGAPSAAYLAAGQIEDAVRIWEDFTSDSQLISPGRLLRGASLMDLDRLVGVFETGVPLHLDRLSGAPPVFVCATNCLTAEPVYLPCTPPNAFKLLKASMALPLIYGPVVPIDGVPYIDGGLTDSIPLHKALEHDAARVIAVLTQPKGYRKSPAPKMAALLALYYRKYPALAPAFARRTARYNACLDALENLEEQGRISVIRPEKRLPATRLSRDRPSILGTLEAGRTMAQSWLKGHSRHVPDGALLSALSPRL